MGRSTEPSMESSLPRLESLEGPLHCCYFLSVRSKHRCSVDKFRAGLYTLLPSSCSRLKLDLLRTWSKGVGMDRWQRWSVGASQTYSSLWNLVRPTGGIGLGAWWGFGDRVGPVSVGVRKRGKPSQWKLPCGWLRRPQHCIYRELPAILEFFHCRVNPFRAAVLAWCGGEKYRTEMGQLDCNRAWSQQLGEWEWSMVSHLSSLTEKETLALGSVKIRVGDGQ